MANHTDVSLSGTHNHKSTWSTLVFSGGLTNWQRMVNAHGTLFGDLPSISEFVQGTYNVILDSTWTPPDDDKYRTNAYNVGVANSGGINNGTDFLEKGNYVHPDITILSINGFPVLVGKLYYAGSPTSFSTPGVPGAITRNYLEILSTQDLETLTGTSGGESVTVDVRYTPPFASSFTITIAALANDTCLECVPFVPPLVLFHSISIDFAWDSLPVTTACANVDDPVKEMIAMLRVSTAHTGPGTPDYMLLTFIATSGGVGATYELVKTNFQSNGVNVFSLAGDQGCIWPATITLTP